MSTSSRSSGPSASMRLRSWQKRNLQSRNACDSGTNSNENKARSLFAARLRLLSDLQAGSAPVAEADKIGFFDMELLEQGGHIIGDLFEAQRAVDIRGMPVRLQLYSDHVMCFCQFRQDAAERGHYSRAPAV